MWLFRSNSWYEYRPPSWKSGVNSSATTCAAGVITGAIFFYITYHKSAIVRVETLCNSLLPPLMEETHWQPSRQTILWPYSAQRYQSQWKIWSTPDLNEHDWSTEIKKHFQVKHTDDKHCQHVRKVFIAKKSVIFVVCPAIIRQKWMPFYLVFSTCIKFLRMLLFYSYNTTLLFCQRTWRGSDCPQSFEAMWPENGRSTMRESMHGLTAAMIIWSQIMILLW
jgi:hypothetical protein